MKNLGVLILIGTISACTLSKKLSKADVEKFRADHLRELVNYDGGPITRDDVKDIHFFSPTQDYYVEAKVQQLFGQEPVVMPTYSGKEKSFIKYAILTFKLDDQPLKLTLYQNVKLTGIKGFEKHLFLPFKDASNGEETYGGGRYIDLTTDDIQNGKVQLDFNKCYNPWCAYSDGFNCPIPPIDNHLPVKILAGEKTYSGKKNKRK